MPGRKVSIFPVLEVFINLIRYGIFTICSLSVQLAWGSLLYLQVSVLGHVLVWKIFYQLKLFAFPPRFLKMISSIQLLISIEPSPSVSCQYHQAEHIRDSG
jgi:hypothetical protein